MDLSTAPCPSFRPEIRLSKPELTLSSFCIFRLIFSLGNVSSPVYIACGGYTLTFGTKSKSSRACSDVCEMPTGTESKSDDMKGRRLAPALRYRDSDYSVFPHFCCQWPISRISYPVFSVKAYNNLLVENRAQNMNPNIFSECLANCHELDLGNIHLKYYGDPNIPCLMTIYEIIQPIDFALSSIKENINELRTHNLGPGAIKGMLALGLSNLETMLGDLLKKYLSFFPQKISLLKGETGTRQEKGEFKVSKETIRKNDILWNIIVKEVDKVLYENIRSIFDVFHKLISIENEIKNDDFVKLIEMKETRNLLLHNNLFVNAQYLNRTETYKRSTEVGEQLTITSEYATESLCLIQNIIEKIKNSILEKYENYTLLEMLKKLWSYTFKPHIKFEDHFTLDTEKDVYDGPLKESRYSLASSELFYLQIWKAQRWGSGIDNFALCHLTDIKKITLLIDVFGALRFPSTIRFKMK